MTKLHLTIDTTSPFTARVYLDEIQVGAISSMSFHQDMESGLPRMWLTLFDLGERNQEIIAELKKIPWLQLTEIRISGADHVPSAPSATPITDFFRSWIKDPENARSFAETWNGQPKNFPLRGVSPTDDIKDPR